MKEKILSIIRENVGSEIKIEIQDASAKHLHHGSGFSKESHFEVLLYIENLNVKEKIDLQKKLSKALSPLYAKELVHSISILLK